MQVKTKEPYYFKNIEEVRVFQTNYQYDNWFGTIHEEVMKIACKKKKIDFNSFYKDYIKSIEAQSNLGESDEDVFLFSQIYLFEHLKIDFIDFIEYNNKKCK